MVNKCCIPGCDSNYVRTRRSRKGSVPSFGFPKDGQQREEWIRKIPRANLEVTKNTVVCEKHFLDSDILRFFSVLGSDDQVVQIPRKKIKLRAGAFPCIFPDHLSSRPSHDSRRKKIYQHDEEHYQKIHGVMSTRKKMCLNQSDVSRDEELSNGVLLTPQSNADDPLLLSSWEVVGDDGLNGDVASVMDESDPSLSLEKHHKEADGTLSSRKIGSDYALTFDPDLLKSTPNIFLGYTKESEEIFLRETQKALTVNDDNDDNDECDRQQNFCCAMYCSNNYRSIDQRSGLCVKMYSFPDPLKDEERCLKWITNLNNNQVTLSTVKTKKVCSVHFEESDFSCPFIIGDGSLLPNAVPMYVSQPSVQEKSDNSFLIHTIAKLEKQLKVEKLKNKMMYKNLSARLTVERLRNRVMSKNISKLKDERLENEIMESKMSELQHENKIYKEELKRVCFLASLDL